MEILFLAPQHEEFTENITIPVRGNIRIRSKKECCLPLPNEFDPCPGQSRWRAR